MTKEELLRIFGYTPENAGELKAMFDQSAMFSASGVEDTTEEWVKLAAKLATDLTGPYLAIFAASAICQLADAQLTALVHGSVRVDGDANGAVIMVGDGNTQYNVFS